MLSIDLQTYIPRNRNIEEFNFTWRTHADAVMNKPR